MTSRADRARRALLGRPRLAFNRWVIQQLFAGPSSTIAGLLVDYGHAPDTRRLTKDQAWLDAWEAAKRAQLQEPWWGYRKHLGRVARLVVEYDGDKWYAKFLRPFVKVGL